MTAIPNIITTEVKFYQAPADGARAFHHINADLTTGERVRNFKEIPHNVEVENVRGQEHTYQLDTHGFQFGVHAAKHQAFDNDADIRKEYHVESAELIKKITGASRVVIFDHTVRRRTGEVDSSPDKRQPVSIAHVDQTPKSGRERVFLHTSAEDAPKLVEKRHQIINLWRPIQNPALDWPLALSDYRSVNPDKDVLPVALIYPHREGETYGVIYNPDLKWKYLRGMRTDEFVLIKCFDSIQDGSVAKFTPHTGIFDPTTPEGTPARQSIELRALVFYD